MSAIPDQEPLPQEASANPVRTEPVKLVLAETYPILLDAMEQVFKSEPGFQVLTCCRTGEEVLRAVNTHRPNLIILDLEVPESGLAVLRQLAASRQPPRVVVMAARLNEREMLEAMRLGAKGMLLKTMPRYLLIQCVRKVHAGEMWFERASMAKAVEQLLRGEECNRRVGALLTHRELEIVRHVAAGRSTREIADQIGVAEGTVKVHLHHVYEKLDVKGRLELILYARDQGLLSSLEYQPPRRTLT